MIKINKKILLGAAIAMASAQQANAVPFAPSDARAMGMGGVGVASSEIASAPRFNPALLANTREDDHFGLKIPQFSVMVADDDGFIDSAEAFDDKDQSGNTNIDNLNAALDIANGVNGISAIETDANALDSTSSAAALEAAAANLEATIDNLRGPVISTEGATTPDSDLYNYSHLIANDVENLNSKALRLNLGGNVALAIPSKKFSLALSTGAQVVFSARATNLENDADLMRNYATAIDRYLTTLASLQQATSAAIDAKKAFDANPNPTTTAAAAATASELDDAQAAVDDFSYGGTAGQGNTVIFQNGALVETNTDLTGELQMVGVSIADVGLTAARTFNIKGHDISFGITPKMQFITIFEHTQQLDSEEEFDSDTITENSEEYSAFNVDLGAAYQFGAEKQWQAGFTLQNLIGDDYESTNGAIVTISPMARAGISHRTSWTKVAFDLDLTENDPVAFEDATQYAALGAEFNVWRTLQLRAGYRANLAGSDQDIVTAGIGFSPLAVHFDIGLMANANDPEKEAGLAVEFGIEF